LVAATTVTLTNGSIPSNSLNSCERTLSATDVSSPPLLTAKESISSKKTIDGEAALAFLNTSRTAFSDSPTHLLNNYIL